MPLVQMNTRIDEALKARGDAVFASIGYSPTSVVRSVWTFAQSNTRNPEKVKSVLDELSGDSTASCELRNVRHEQVRAFEQTRRRLCCDLGADPDRFGTSACDATSNADLRAMAFSDRLKIPPCRALMLATQASK